MSVTVEALDVRRFHYFRELSDDEAAEAAAGLEAVQVGPGDQLFRQGTGGDSAYLLVRGRVEIKVAVSQTQDRVLATLLPGAIFGEVSLLSDEPRTAAAVARAESELWVVTRPAFSQAIERRETWAIRLLEAMAEVLCRRLSSVDQELAALIGRNGTAASPTDRQRFADLQSLHQHLFAAG